jgi:5,10-methylenetetrahydrofolate reductase
MTKLKEALTSGKFVVTSEVGPPKGVNIEECINHAEALKERITAFNVTDLQSAMMRFGSLAACRFLVERGMEPVLQMTCRDRNRLALQSDLLSRAKQLSNCREYLFNIGPNCLICLASMPYLFSE